MKNEAMSPYVSIIIPTKNAGSRFDLILKRILASRAPFSYEIIVVDSGSIDGTKRLISNYSIKLIEIAPSSFSHGGARNIGAENAQGEILVYLSQDALPKDENWLTNLTVGFNDPDVAGIFGRQIPNDGASALERFFLEYIYPDYRIVKDSVKPRNCTLQDIFFSDVNSAIRKSEWKENRFKDSLIMSEDQAWAKDMLMKNKKILYEPTAIVYHSHNYTIRKVIMRNFDSGLSLKDILDAPFKRNLLYEVRYIKSALRHFFKNNLYRYFAIFPFYEFFRLLGFLVGRYSRLLPLWLKKALSQNKAYWQKE
ncbi:MAG: glycosyltransferase [Candidatus Omnitrophota bacterium]|nr:glycosyltransferase [Candidatus Omnitrophota bacterium]